MPPTPVRMMLTATSSWGSLAISSSSASAEPATSALTSRLSSLSSPAWMSLKMSSSERLRPERRACCSCLRRCSRSCASWRARRSFSTAWTCSPASGTPSKPSASTGSPGMGLLDALAGEVVHRPHPAPVGARDERVADPQRAALDEDRDDRAAARVELGLDDDAGGRRGRVGLELLELGDDEQRVEQLLEADLRLRGDVDELGLAAPLDGLQAARRHLGAHPRRVRALLVDLVDRDDDRHVGRLRVVDRLGGLRLHAVVGGHDDDRDVGHAGAAGAHRGEGLVARRVEERHELPVVMDLVGADVLGDAAGLAGDDLGRADRVQQRRLAVVDVAHDRDDGRARDEILVGVLVDGLGWRPRRRRGRARPPCRTPRRAQHGLVGERLRERRHLAEHHQLLDDLGDGHAHRLGDVLDGRAGVDANEIGVRRGGLVERAHRVVVRAAAATAATLATGRLGLLAGRAARGLRVDDDAAAAAGAGRAGGALTRQRGARRALLGGVGGGIDRIGGRRRPGAAWPEGVAAPARGAGVCAAGLGPCTGRGRDGRRRARADAGGRSEIAGGGGGPRRIVTAGAGGGSGAFAASAAAPLVGSGRPAIAAAAWSTSTAEAGALTEMPAARSLSNTSLEDMLWVFASS